MGSYNTQYQSYYSNLMRNNKRQPYRSKPATGKARKIVDKNFLVRRVMQELIGVFCLIFIVLLCKIIKTPEISGFYDYCKSMVSYSYDYNSIYENIKNIKLEDVSSNIEEYIDKLKSDITGEKTLREKISTEFIVPVSGKVTTAYGEQVDPAANKSTFNNGIDINLAEGTEVKCSGEGVVKFIGEDESFGKYILIDHGLGIETKYANLKETKVQDGDAVRTGEVIALSGNSGKSDAPHLHFELLYMGDNKNPEEYINFSANIEK